MDENTQAPIPEQEQPAEQVSQETPPSKEQELAERLSQLEQSYKEAQRKITRQGQELSEYKKMVQSQPQPPQSIPSDAFFTDPVNVTKQVVSSALQEFEQRQEQRRAAEELMQSTAERHGIPVRDFQKYYQRLQESTSDPDALMDMLARMYRADNAEAAIAAAKQSAEEAVKTKSRAVTSEGQPQGASPPGKSLADMPLDELEKYIKEKYGVEQR